MREVEKRIVYAPRRYVIDLDRRQSDGDTAVYVKASITVPTSQQEMTLPKFEWRITMAQRPIPYELTALLNYIAVLQGNVMFLHRRDLQKLVGRPNWIEFGTRKERTLSQFMALERSCHAEANMAASRLVTEC